LKNFILRAITGLLFVAILLGCILYGPLFFVLLFAGIAGLCVFEFATLVNRTQGVTMNRILSGLGGVYLFLAFMGFCIDVSGFSLFIPYLMLLVYLMVSELYRKQENPVNNWAYTMLSQLYVALPFALLNVLAFRYNEADRAIGYDAILPLSVFVFIWLNDTGAYCAGLLFGKHKLFKRISPKKSWEGSIGGATAAIASSFAFASYFPLLTLPGWVGLAAVVVVFGTWGDLTESLFKRHLEIKDSGTILPGHGGMLDRFDSFLIAVPAAVIYLLILEQFA
jgi:phosphatidate cytidylyltransferase